LFKNKKDPSPLDFGVIFSNNKEQGKFLKVSGILNPDKNLLKVGDEVIEIDNVKVLNPTQLNNESRGKSNVTLKILRDKKEQEVKLQLKPRGSVTERIGLIFSNVIVSDRALISRLPINQIMSNPKSSLVVQNLKSGPASGKLRKYDVLNYIDGKEFKTVQSLYDYLKDKKEIDVVFRRPGVDEERKLIFNDYHDKIEVQDVKILKF
jgi:PDZ domain-containing secreted protein